MNKNKFMGGFYLAIFLASIFTFIFSAVGGIVSYFATTKQLFWTAGISFVIVFFQVVYFLIKSPKYEDNNRN